MTLEETLQKVIEKTCNEVDKEDLALAVREHIKQVAEGMMEKMDGSVDYAEASARNSALKALCGKI